MDTTLGRSSVRAGQTQIWWSAAQARWRPESWRGGRLPTFRSELGKRRWHRTGNGKMRRRRRISAGSGWASIRVELTVEMAADRGGLAAVGDAPIRRQSGVREAAHGRPEQRRPSASALAAHSGETAQYAWHPKPAVFSSAHHDSTGGVGHKESEASMGGRLDVDARARL
ncbi:hypothetical protein M6B38_312545 [Iris pallida]|uniref:Uncharacterized protein n=1 Tax=Iris pallida TaxID=29817 RepID=A0AAX6HGR8_IRIPA|nr:hypothetical protein M6B38_312545 [Iris pallida]